MGALNFALFGLVIVCISYAGKNFLSFHTFGVSLVYHECRIRDSNICV